MEVRRPALWALLILALALLATRLVSVFTVAANWDEFGLLQRAHLTAETGVLH